MSQVEPRFIRLEHKREVVTYSELWHASGCVLDKGLNDQTGSAWQFLSSIALSAFSFEAYLNHVGDSVVQNWSDLERVLSPEAKLRHLCLTLGVEIGSSGERPLQTVTQLIRIRNQLAHGRSETIEPKPEIVPLDEYYEDHMRKRPLTPWEKCIQDADFAVRVREDVAQILRILHEALPDPKGALFAMGMHFSSGSPAE